MSTRYASLFVSHGAPTLPITDIPARAALKHLGTALERPRAIVTLSPHWMTGGVEVKAPKRYQTWHDFGGFPEELYDIQYTPAGDPALAQRVLDLINAAGIDARASDDERLDHGVWVPLMLMYPAADIPVVQVSATMDSPRSYFELGKALQPLTGEGILVLGSGGAVHNLGALDWSGGARPPAWALEFEAWARKVLSASDFDQLADFQSAAPALDLAHPTLEHFLPLLVAAGAALPDENVSFPITGFEYGSLSRLAAHFRS